ncbi:MAG: hypothetical protein WAK70_15925, partial [Candidatus Sulfotelmatobacter sp.]
ELELSAAPSTPDQLWRQEACAVALAEAGSMAEGSTLVAAVVSTAVEEASTVVAAEKIIR